MTFYKFSKIVIATGVLVSGNVALALPSAATEARIEVRIRFGDKDSVYALAKNQKSKTKNDKYILSFENSLERSQSRFVTASVAEFVRLKARSYKAAQRGLASGCEGAQMSIHESGRKPINHVTGFCLDPNRKGAGEARKLLKVLDAYLSL